MATQDEVTSSDDDGEDNTDLARPFPQHPQLSAAMGRLVMAVTEHVDDDSHTSTPTLTTPPQSPRLYAQPPPAPLNGYSQHMDRHGAWVQRPRPQQARHDHHSRRSTGGSNENEEEDEEVDDEHHAGCSSTAHGQGWRAIARKLSFSSRSAELDDGQLGNSGTTSAGEVAWGTLVMPARVQRLWWQRHSEVMQVCGWGTCVVGICVCGHR